MFRIFNDATEQTIFDEGKLWFEVSYGDHDLSEYLVDCANLGNLY